MQCGDVSEQNGDPYVADSDSVLEKLFFSSKISALSPGSTYDASLRYVSCTPFFEVHPNPPHNMSNFDLHDFISQIQLD